MKSITYGIKTNRFSYFVGDEDYRLMKNCVDYPMNLIMLYLLEQYKC